MPRDPKRNLQRYQLQGGHLNEFEFQKRQNEIAEDAALRFGDETDRREPTLAKQIAEVTNQAHQKVEKRRKRGQAKRKGQQTSVSGKKSTKKVVSESATKTTKKTTKRMPAKKRATVNTKSKKRAATRFS